MSIDPLVRFLNYALAFESAFFTDEWKAIEPYFTEDAVSEIQGTLFPGRFSGREAVLAAFKSSCDQFDRRFDSREPQFLEPPERIEGGIYIKFVVTYSRNSLPPLALLGEEWNYFRGERIERHIECFSNEDEVSEFLACYYAHLVPERK
jgi:hypothetical protein